MLIAPFPSNEEVRLRFLRSPDILDTPPEERFDRITQGDGRTVPGADSAGLAGGCREAVVQITRGAGG